MSLQRPKPRVARKRQISLATSIVAALTGVVLVVAAVAELAGRPWAMLLAGVVLVYAAHIIDEAR